MLTHEITAIAGKNKKRKRLGRGQGSGHGKTSGRGHKGAGSRAGFKKKTIYEGGQMPLFRRLPKRGFSNVQFETKYEIVNISQLDAFEDGSKVGLEELHKAGLVNLAKSRAAKVKILGDGELSKKLEVSAHKFSKAAQDKITGIGGSATVLS